MKGTTCSFAAFLLFGSSLSGGAAFQPKIPFSSQASTGISSRRTAAALFSLPTAVDARDSLLDTAERLKKIDGVLLVDKTSKKALTDAVEELEALCRPPTEEEFKEKFLGDWTLLCSTATNTAGLDTSKLPFVNMSPIKNFSDLLKRSLVVKQVIKGKKDGHNKVDRIDHVLEYQPPDTLKEIMDNLPDALKTLNINPLHVTEGKLTLVHKASVESVSPVPKTKLSLESIIFSVAGNSQYLDGSGADVLGINLPFGEFLNSGTFETTYMDDEIRISRGKLGVVDQLRVFVRSEIQEEIEEEEEEAEAEEEAKKEEAEEEEEESKEKTSDDDDEESDVAAESGDI